MDEYHYVNSLSFKLIVEVKMNTCYPKIGEWIKDIKDMSEKEEVIYHRMMMLYCNHQILFPNNPKWIEDNIKVKGSAETIKAIIATFFVPKDKYLIHRRESKIVPFDDFWEIYLRKDNKKKAKLLWDKMNVSEETFAKINIHISMTYQFTERKFIPLPTSYLNGERWEDEIAPDNSVAQSLLPPGVQRTEDVPFHELHSDTSWRDGLD